MLRCQSNFSTLCKKCLYARMFIQLLHFHEKNINMCKDVNSTLAATWNVCEYARCRSFALDFRKCKHVCQTFLTSCKNVYMEKFQSTPVLLLFFLLHAERVNWTSQVTCHLEAQWITWTYNRNWSFIWWHPNPGE